MANSKPSQPQLASDLSNAAIAADCQNAYDQASSLAESGAHDESRAAYIALVAKPLPMQMKALVENDLGALAVLAGDAQAAKVHFESALVYDSECQAARCNLSRLDADHSGKQITSSTPMATANPIESRISHETGYAPRILAQVDESRLVIAVAEFFGLQRPSVARMWETYRKYSQQQGYAERFGEWKTLTTEEAFLLGVSMSLTRPRVIVELGTQYGKSTRRIVDLAEFLGLDARIITYDVVDELQYVGHDEIDFRQEDLTGRFRADILDKFGSGFIFSDAPPFALLSEVVRETLAHYGNWTLAIHDCGPGLCNPHMRISREDPNISSSTGLWERHILAEIFGIDDPLSPALDSQHTATSRMHIFETQHGMALIAPMGCSGSSGESQPSDRVGSVIGI